MNYCVRQLLLLGFFSWASSVVALPAHAPLVTYEQARGFILDENFKFHHSGLLECIDFLYKSDIGRLYANDVLRQALPTGGWGNVNVSACEEAARLAKEAADHLKQRYDITLLEGVNGINEDARDLSTCFAYHEETNTLIMAFCGMDEPLDKENVLDAELMLYPDSQPADNVLVHRGLFERSYKEFIDIVRPTFLGFWEGIKQKQSGLKIIITGHSLGGGRALMHATLLAEWLQAIWYAQSNKIKVYNLSGILPGNAAFVNYMETLLGANNIITQATPFDKGPVLQPGAGGYNGAGFVDCIKRYNAAPCPIPGWYAYDYACDVWNRNYEQRYHAWQDRRQKYSFSDRINPKNWRVIMKDRYYSFTAGPMHYMAAVNEFYNNWFDPAIVGGYGDPTVIEAKLLPQGVRAQETRQGRVERFLGRWVTVVGTVAGLL